MSNDQIPLKDKLGNLSQEYQDNVIDSLLINALNFHIYESYLRNYYHAKSALTHLEENKYKEFFNKVYSDPACCGHNLESLVVMPAQRIPRYRLLFETLLKQYPDTNDNKEKRKKILNILDIVSALADKCNKYAGNFEEFSDITKIYERISFDARLKPRAIRRYVNEGSFRKVVRHSSTTEPVNLILFNDVLLIAAKISDKESPDKLAYQYSFDLSIFYYIIEYVRIEDLPSKNNDYGKKIFEFIINAPENCIVLQVDDKETKRTWIKLINDTIRERLSNLTETADEVHLIMGDGCSNIDCINGNINIPSEKKAMCYMCCCNICLDCCKKIEIVGSKGKNLLSVCPKCYKDHENKRISKNEVLVKANPLPQNWEVKKEGDLQIYTNNITHERSLLHPNASFYLDKLYCTEILPPNWKRSYTKEGDKFYIDFKAKRAQWNYPKDEIKSPPNTPQNS